MLEVLEEPLDVTADVVLTVELLAGAVDVVALLVVATAEELDEDTGEARPQRPACAPGAL